MTKNLWRVLSITVVVLLVASAGSLAEVIVDEDFSTLDEEVWRIFRNSNGGTIGVEDGQLVIADVDRGWRQLGLVLRQPIVLTEGVTTVVVEYVEALHNEQNPGFWADGDIEGEDNWGHPGIRLTGQQEAFNLTVVQGGSGQFTPGSGSLDIEYPAVVTWKMTPQEDHTLAVEVHVDGEGVYEGTLSLTAPNVEEPVFFYFYVSNESQSGPTVVDRIVVTQE